MQALRAEDGPPLPLVGDMCWSAQLQGLLTLSDILDPILLGLLCDNFDMGVE